MSDGTDVGADDDGTGGGQAGGESADELRERVPRNEAWVWVLLGANRWALACGLLVAVWVVLVAAGLANPTPAHELLTSGGSLETLYNALVGSTVTGVTLVLTLSQLVIQQEQGAAGDQRERMEAAVSFRADAADAMDEPVSPARPSAFLRALVDATATRADRLADALDAFDGEARGDAERLVDAVRSNASSVGESLDGAQFGEFDVVWAALDYNYSWKLYEAERLRAGAADGSAAASALDDLTETLEAFGVAREHFKTLYFQWELTALSRTVLYASVPAVVTAAGALLFFDPRGVHGAVLGVPVVLAVAAATVVVALAPFAVLLAYVLRIVTVTRRTLAIGPFVLRETDDTGDSM